MDEKKGFLDPPEEFDRNEWLEKIARNIAAALAVPSRLFGVYEIDATWINARTRIQAISGRTKSEVDGLFILLKEAIYRGEFVDSNFALGWLYHQFASGTEIEEIRKRLISNG